MKPSDLFDLSGKVAIVTGGNGGLGLAMALGLAGAGANIVVAARNTDKTSEALSQIQGLGVPVSYTHLRAHEEPQDLAADEWDQVMDVNLRAGFLAAKAVYPHMKSQGGGKIINIGSMFSLFGGGGSGAPYSSSKGGLVQLSKSLAIAWAKDKIQSNAILPGWFMTDLTAAVPANQPERYDMISRRIPYAVSYTHLTLPTKA